MAPGVLKLPVEVDPPAEPVSARTREGTSVAFAPHRYLDTGWAVALVLSAAFFTRFFMVTQWSLWQDEETSVYFSLNLGKSFALHAPLFFGLLRGLFVLTGPSVAAGRYLVASLGFLDIVLIYLLIRALLGRPAAVLAAGFVVVSLGHLFWSQSIRYYILLFTFQIASVYFFIDGFERNRPRQLILVSICLFLAVLSHLSAALLFPVFIAYLLWNWAAGDAGPGYNGRALLIFAVPFAAASIVLLFRGASFRQSMPSLIQVGSAALLRPVPVGLLQRFALYFGPAAVLLSLAAPFLGRGMVPRRILRFLTCLAFVPVLEVVAIRDLRFVFPLWYQGFIGLVGVAALAAITLHALLQRRHMWTYRLAMGGAVAASLPLLTAYYTTMHGDRPRVREAVEYVRNLTQSDASGDRSPHIYSDTPGVVAFYLGYSASVTMTQSQVERLPRVLLKHEGPAWIVAERGAIRPAVRAYIDKECAVAASFAASTGPRDRTVFAYRCGA